VGKGKMEELEDEIKRMLLPLIQKQGYELVDLKLKGSGPPSVLRIYVDKAGGITLDECARLSEKLSDYLDLEDLINHRYTLEVSSPGLDRPLVTNGDFRRKIGEQVKVFLKSPLDEKTEFEGKIVDFKDGKVFLNKGKEMKVIPLENIQKAKILF
jgi:ribosome maturation factor RimP